jgi:hypothetical protein
MTKEQILSSLCVYDERNPYYLPFDVDDLLIKPTDCSCDNCFYGRTKMADFILSELSKQEISDEEIQKQAFKYVYKCKISDNHVYSFIDGIRWYREQLKQRQ